jgi:hypothetical protein
MINKVLFVKREEESTWVSIQEYPGEKIVLEGIRINPATKEDLLTQRILFSKEAIKMIAPLLNEWLKEKEKEDENI